jgi:hypothetical protein
MSQTLIDREKDAHKLTENDKEGHRTGGGGR